MPKKKSDQSGHPPASKQSTVPTGQFRQGASLAPTQEAREIKDKPYVMVCDTRLFAGIDCLLQALPMAHYAAKGTADWDAGLQEVQQQLDKLNSGTY